MAFVNTQFGQSGVNHQKGHSNVQPFKKNPFYVTFSFLRNIYLDNPCNNLFMHSPTLTFLPFKKLRYCPRLGFKTCGQSYKPSKFATQAEITASRLNKKLGCCFTICQIECANLGK